MKTRKHVGASTQNSEGAATDDDHVAVRGVFAYRVLHGTEQFLVERLLGRRRCKLRRGPLERVKEALPESPLRVFVRFDGLRRDAQTLCHDDRQLLVDELVTERVGNPCFAIFEGTGTVFVGDSYDHRRRSTQCRTLVSCRS